MCQERVSQCTLLDHHQAHTLEATSEMISLISDSMSLFFLKMNRLWLLNFLDSFLGRCQGFCLSVFYKCLKLLLHFQSFLHTFVGPNYLFILLLCPFLSSVWRCTGFITVAISSLLSLLLLYFIYCYYYYYYYYYYFIFFHGFS